MVDYQPSLLGYARKGLKHRGVVIAKDLPSKAQRRQTLNPLTRSRTHDLEVEALDFSNKTNASILHSVFKESWLSECPGPQVIQKGQLF
ncbi:hypothetical protein CFREI_02240 [Corynebacterium freiburgense]|nr:hypothetical protein CFREI_02240 [Corynebacterium freiburgense]